MLRSIILSTIVTIVLTGCVVAPKLVSFSEEPTAVAIKTKWARESSFVWDRIEIVAVNNRFITSLYSEGSVKVSPGRNVVTTKMTFNRGFGSGPFEGLVTLNLDLPPNGRFVLNGDVDGGDIRVWIEGEADKTRGSELVKAPWRMAPKEPTTIPIFIPR